MRLVIKERVDLQSLGGELANREIYDYFTKCKIVTDYQLFKVIRTHCLPVEFVNDLEELEWETVPKEICRPIKYLWKYGEF